VIFYTIKLRWYIATTIIFSSYIIESSSTRRPVHILPRTGVPVTLTTEHSETTIPMVVGHKQGTSLHGNQLFFVLVSTAIGIFFAEYLSFLLLHLHLAKAPFINHLKQSIVIIRLLYILRFSEQYFLHGILPYVVFVHRGNLVQKIILVLYHIV
jgi:hypothetical protein